MAWHVKLKVRRWKFDGSQLHIAASCGSNQYIWTNTQIRKAGNHSEIMLDQHTWLISKLNAYAILVLWRPR